MAVPAWRGFVLGLSALSLLVFEELVPMTQDSTPQSKQFVKMDNPEANSVELAQQIDCLLSQVGKYTARAAYSIAGQLLYERESKAISSS